jgi:hypothetical protein
VPSWTTASFSAAISSRVSPSTSVCSRPTLVSRTTCERRTFVASRRPPRPASTTATSISRAANSANAAAIRVSNCVASCDSASGRTRSIAASKSASAPSTVIRSAHERTCGETVAPTDRPSASRYASIVRVAVDFPFVPTTWIAG